MIERPIYWRGREESILASYQQDQGSSNHCAKYAAASAINMLTGLEVNGEQLVGWLDKRFFKGTLRYTIIGNNNGSLVFQTANQIRWLAFRHGLPLEVKLQRRKVTDLENALEDGGAVSLVSITYFQGEEPAISRGKATNTSLAKANWVGGHIMILGAYDPDHLNYAGHPTPWGFISSWGNKDEMYWMTNSDFQRTWGRLSILNMIRVRIK